MHRNLFTIILSLSFIATSESALAAYIVIDDDLMPTNTVAPQTQTFPPAHYVIPFNKGQSTLSISAKRILNGLTYQMRGATIRIVGRPDAYSKSQDTTTLSAVDRATNIRSHLTSQGIPTNNINIDIENTPANSHANSRFTNVDLYIARPAKRTPAQAVTQPTQNAQPAHPKKNWVYETLNIPFCATKSEPGPVAQSILNEATRKLSRAREIIVQGRVDKDSADTTIAYSRTDFLRKWLLRIGVPENQIKTEFQTAYRQSGYTNCGYSNISYKALQTTEETQYAQQEQQDEDEQTVKASVPANVATIQPVQVQPQTDPDMIPMSVIRRAFTMSDIARFDKINTLKLIENIHLVRQTNPNQTDEQIIIDLIIRQATPLPTETAKPAIAMPAPTATPPIVTAPAPTIIAATSTMRKESWMLDKNLTLRDNVDAWSKHAGWNPSVWDASNYYQITVTSTIEGDFPDILRQIADSTGLNICARKRERYVRVTDPKVPCDKY